MIIKQILSFGAVHLILSFAIFFLLKFLANLPNEYNLLSIVLLGIMISSTAIVIGYPINTFIKKKFFKPPNDVLIHYDIKYIYATMDNNEGIVKIEFKANYLDFYLKGSKEYEQYKEIAIKNNQQ